MQLGADIESGAEVVGVVRTPGDHARCALGPGMAQRTGTQVVEKNHAGIDQSLLPFRPRLTLREHDNFARSRQGDCHRIGRPILRINHDMASRDRKQIVRNALASPCDRSPDDRIDRDGGSEEAAEPQEGIMQKVGLRPIEIAVLRRKKSEGIVEHVGDACPKAGLWTFLPGADARESEPAQDQEGEDRGPGNCTDPTAASDQNCQSCCEIRAFVLYAHRTPVSDWPHRGRAQVRRA